MKKTDKKAELIEKLNKLENEYRDASATTERARLSELPFLTTLSGAKDRCVRLARDRPDYVARDREEWVAAIEAKDAASAKWRPYGNEVLRMEIILRDLSRQIIPLQREIDKMEGRPLQPSLL